VELERLREHEDGVEDEHAVEAKQLSRSVRDISNALVNLIVLPIQDIPLQPRSTKDVLTTFSLIWERLWEEDAFGAGSQV
jgi:hypothetical protein